MLPQTLMELMRHSSLTTTLKFYVGQNAERTADALWQVHDKLNQGQEGNKGGNNAQNRAAKETATDRT